MVAALSVVLVLISIGTILGPVGAVVIIYHDDLTQLFITPQIRDTMNGNSTIFLDMGQSDNQNGNGNSNDNGNPELGGLMNPVFVSAQIDQATHSFTGVFNVTNNFGYNLTLNSFSTDVQITQNNIPAGSISLSSPVTVHAGETSQLTATGQWSQAAQDYVTNNFQSAASLDISLTNISINVNGITIQTAGPFQISVPTNVVG
jgi:hypothetical protein